MKRQLLISAGIATLLLGSGAAWLHLHEEASHSHGHEHGEKTPAEVAVPAVRWQSDAQLQASMNAIRDAVAAAAVNAENAVKLPQLVNTQIDLMVRNCRLAPEADAALHTLLAGLTHGAQQAAVPATRSEGLTLLQSALDDYPRYFEHPHWQPFP